MRKEYTMLGEDHICVASIFHTRDENNAEVGNRYIHDAGMLGTQVWDARCGVIYLGKVSQAHLHDTAAGSQGLLFHRWVT